MIAKYQDMKQIALNLMTKNINMVKLLVGHVADILRKVKLSFNREMNAIEYAHFRESYAVERYLKAVAY